MAVTYAIGHCFLLKQLVISDFFFWRYVFCCLREHSFAAPPLSKEKQRDKVLVFRGCRKPTPQARSVSCQALHLAQAEFTLTMGTCIVHAGYFSVAFLGFWSIFIGHLILRGQARGFDFQVSVQAWSIFFFLTPDSHLDVLCPRGSSGNLLQ